MLLRESISIFAMGSSLHGAAVSVWVPESKPVHLTQLTLGEITC